MTTEHPEGVVRAFAVELVACRPNSRQWRVRLDRLYSEGCEHLVIARLEMALMALKEECATWEAPPP